LWLALGCGGGWEVISEQRATVGVLWLGFAFYFVIFIFHLSLAVISPAQADKRN
jgi:hypothetical protein